MGKRGIHRNALTVHTKCGRGLAAAGILALLITFMTSCASEPETKGIVTKETGDCISGDCINGKGTKVWTEEGSPGEHRYTGQWKNGKRHGQGTYTWPNGETYTGDWKNSMRDGLGIYRWRTGDRYEGGWANDQKNGPGVIFSKERTVLLKGIWENDHYKGEKGEREVAK